MGYVGITAFYLGPQYPYQLSTIQYNIIMFVIHVHYISFMGGELWLVGALII